MGFKCRDCNNFDRTERKGDEYRCYGWNTWVKPDKVANSCRKFCYVTTKVSEILNLDYYDENVVACRDLIMQQFVENPEFKQFFDDYNEYGVMVCDKLTDDKYSEIVAGCIYNNCFVPVKENISLGNLDFATNLYMNMFYDLAEYENVEIASQIEDEMVRKRK